MTKPTHLLILGGTAEASALATSVAERFGEALLVTTSLAGRTAHPLPIAGTVRRGGFGGADGLAAWLGEHAVDVVVDATHPFAATISANAVDACRAAGVPRLRLQRPAWQRHASDRWIEVADLDEAAKALPKIGKRAFLTIGTQELAAFSEVRDVWFLVRLIDPPRDTPPIAGHEIILGRGPFTLAEERRIIEHHAIDVLVTKASGGAATETKLIAARAAGLPVVMVRRPPPPPGPLVSSVEAALDWVTARRR